ncbi:multiple sugar transport system ATP-binding protein [Clostridium collagenovorans DSM 3089]|uniref:Multiple sugar transport system ATP-binding protein n=1 Tax=Clostridium collagenovorans DSM 3089 TaxID=1121306 RepID=A0A1M5WMX8_9CLOT|nr:sn-glycerol-3-phosphate ABC transporter ATP-binding protein UgpC [Clostridium collagenovorans]SHH88839.1 multiple sugar transport system ATP-binding protein [Clostridium collagenovorans DSM 3089]
MARIKLENLNKKYANGFEAVKNINLDIEDKEFIVLVGPSGCGKSTTLRMIAGLEEVTSGAINIGEENVTEMEPKDRDIAMVFQNYALYPHMTVYENMAFSLKVRKLKKDEIKSKVNEVADILGIQDLLKRKPAQLSGGQRQRVALGRAMVRSPRVFLMDEPLSNLDAKLRVQTRAEIIKLHKMLQTTFVYVTHDQTEAMTMGTRIVVMNDGVIQQVDTPQNIYDNPNNIFVAGFIGSPQMNFIEGKLSNNGEVIFKGGSFKLNKFGIKSNEDEVAVDKTSEKIVVVGVRAEAVQLEEREDMEPMVGQVEFTEHLGSEMLVYVKTECGTIVSRTAPSYKYNIGENINIYFDLDKIHIFDKNSEEKIRF